MSIEDLSGTPVYAISVVAQLTGMHPQTLRQYDRLGLVAPQRTAGGGRRYSARDVDRLREIQQLSAEGIGLIGVKRIFELELHVEALRARVAELEAELERTDGSHVDGRRAGAVGTEMVLRDRTSVVVWRRPPRSPLG
ncbi:MAG TPA: helix-turn-helix transcriptional regulator [Actinomycetes bacterium]|nr:helix-turn-helix transcriptional regulator [Actinomycetes bacterium]